MPRGQSTTSSDPSPPAWLLACFEQRHEPAQRPASGGSVQPRSDGLFRQDALLHHERQWHARATGPRTDATNMLTLGMSVPAPSLITTDRCTARRQMRGRSRGYRRTTGGSAARDGFDVASTPSDAFNRRGVVMICTVHCVTGSIQRSQLRTLRQRATTSRNGRASASPGEAMLRGPFEQVTKKAAIVGTARKSSAVRTRCAPPMPGAALARAVAHRPARSRTRRHAPR